MSNLTAVALEKESEILKVFGFFDISLEGLRLYENTVGFVNKTYIVETVNKKYVLRESNASTTKEHVELEIEALLFLEKRGYKYTPRILPNKKGEFLTEINNRYYTLQNFIPGEIRASWNNLDHFSLPMLENFFKFSAEFALAVKDFKPTKQYSNFPISYYVNNGEDLFESALKKIPDSQGKKLLKDKMLGIESFLQGARKELEVQGYDGLPKQFVHFDLHPGNVHFDEDNKVVGLFDFDWARFDCRISDIAATISQSCYIFGGEQSGMFVKENIQRGLSAYREVYKNSEFGLKEENLLIKVALQGYVFFQLLWAMDWYKDNHEDKESFPILRHVINTCLNNDYEQLFN